MFNKNRLIHAISCKKHLSRSDTHHVTRNGVHIRRYICILLYILLCDCNETTHTPHASHHDGSLRSIPHKTSILTLRGTHYQRGFQHGSLLAEEIIHVFHHVYLTTFMDGNRTLYDSAYTFITSYMHFDSNYIEEAKGMLAGIRSYGSSLYDTTLKRSIRWQDLLMMSCVEEMYTITGEKMGCSSISSWGDATQHDSLVHGGLIFTRHWDYARIDSLISHILLIAHIPSEPDEQPWISACWAGMIGSCSAISSDRVGAFLNYGPLDTNRAVYATRHRPLSLSIRKAIETHDLDNNGKKDPRDVEYALRQYRPYFGAIIHAATTVGNHPGAMVIECNNARGVVVRTQDENTRIPADHLVATNHFRLLHEPIACRRYDAIVDSLSVNPDMTTTRSWSMMADAASYPGCLYSLTWLPSQNHLHWAQMTLTDKRPAYKHRLVTIDCDSIWENNG